jgi:hypothetical protein
MKKLLTSMDRIAMAELRHDIYSFLKKKPLKFAQIIEDFKDRLPSMSEERLDRFLIRCFRK